MKTVRTNARSWILGTLIALAGVALVRAVAPSLSDRAKIFVTVAGQLLALGGLFIICLGVRRRIQLTAETREPAPDSTP